MTEQPEENQPVAGLLAKYLETAERWDASQSNADAANESFDQNHALYKRLRPFDEGRSGIAHLMTHKTVGVRLLAATHSLTWSTVDAVTVLRTIAEDGGLHRVTATYTLRAYEAGQLDLEW